MSALALCVWTCTAESLFAKEPYRIPAFWTEPKNDVAPRTMDFEFHDLRFTGPGTGWVVGHPFVLEVRDHTIAMTVFHESHLYAVASAGAGDTWLGGARFRREGRDSIARGVIWHRRDDTWKEEPVADMLEHHWSIRRLVFAAEHEGWALASVGGGFEPASVILRYDGTHWSAADDLTPDRLQWQGADLCVTATGGGWIVGRQPVALQDDGHRYAVAFGLEEGHWVRKDPPPLPFKRVALKQVACGPAGGAIATGLAQRSEPPWSAPFVPVLLKYTSRWEPLEPPDHLGAFLPASAAIVSENEFWLAGSHADFTPAFIHVKDGTWIEVPAPMLPDGRYGYSIIALSFPSPDEGWAAGTDYKGVGISRGLVLHYKDGVWRNRNWDWHFWHERGWGLIGP